MQEVFQPLLFRTNEVQYLCLNDNCFYVESILAFADVVWREVWDSSLHDLAMIPHCPSCNEVMWREEIDANEARKSDNG